MSVHFTDVNKVVVLGSEVKTEHNTTPDQIQETVKRSLVQPEKPVKQGWGSWLWSIIKPEVDDLDPDFTYEVNESVETEEAKKIDHEKDNDALSDVENSDSDEEIDSLEEEVEPELEKKGFDLDDRNDDINNNAIHSPINNSYKIEDVDSDDDSDDEVFFDAQDSFDSDESIPPLEPAFDSQTIENEEDDSGEIYYETSSVLVEESAQEVATLVSETVEEKAKDPEVEPEVVQSTTSHQQGVANKTYNFFSSVFSAAKAFTYSVVDTGAELTTNAFLDVAFFGFNYNTESTKYRDELRQATGSDYIDNFLKDVAPNIAENLKNYVNSRTFPGSGYLKNYVAANSSFLHEIVEVTLLRIFANLAKKIREEKNIPHDVQGEEFICAMAEYLTEKYQAKGANPEALSQLVDEILVDAMPGKFSELGLIAPLCMPLNYFAWPYVKDGIGKALVSAKNSISDITAPQKSREEHLDKLTNLIFGSKTPAEQNERREIIDNATKTIAQSITSSVKENIDKNNTKILDFILGKVPKDVHLSPQATNLLKGVLVAGNNNKALLGYLDVVIQTALLRSGAEFVGSVKLEEGKEISQLIIHLVNLINEFGPELNQKRMEEKRFYQKTLADLATDYNKDVLTINKRPDLTEDEKRKELAELVKIRDGLIETAKAYHKEALRKIYQPYAESIIKKLTPDEQNAIPIPQQFRQGLWDYITQEFLPNLIAKRHDQSLMWQDQRDEMILELDNRFGSDAAEKIAKAGAHFAQKYIPHHLEKEPQKTAEKIFTKLVGFFKKQADKGSNEGKKVTDYLASHSVEFTKNLCDNVNNLVSDKGTKSVWPASKDFIEAFFMKVLVGFDRKLVAKLAKNKNFLADNAADGMQMVADKLKAQRTANNNQEPPTAEEIERLNEARQAELLAIGEKLINGIDLTKDDVPFADVFLWDALKQAIAPLALEWVFNTLSNKNILNKIILNSLKAYDDNKTKNAQAQATYKKLKREAKRLGLELPEKPKSTFEVQTDPTQLALNKASADLVKELVHLTGDNMLIELLESKGDAIGPIMGSVIRQQLSNEMLKKFIKMGYEAAPDALNNTNFPKTPEEIAEANKLKAAAEKKVFADTRNIIKKVARDEIKSAAKGFIKNLWNKFQTKFDEFVFAKLGSLSLQTKMILDRVCRFLFITVLGTILELVSTPFTMIGDYLLGLYIDYDGKKLLEGVHKTFDKELTKGLGKSILDHLVDGMPKVAADLVDHIHVEPITY